MRENRHTVPDDPHETEVLSTSRRGNGKQRVLKVNRNGHSLVFKCYGSKRGRIRTAAREFGSLLLVGKSSIIPKARLRTERAVLQLWRREGFDVPRILSADPPEGLDEPYLCLEWIPGTSLGRFLHSAETSLEDKARVIERFAALLGRRHERALALREPRLLFENPTFEHVLLSGDRMVHFDFEIVFIRKRDLDRLARREIAGFLAGLPQEKETLATLLDRFVDAYPHEDLLNHTSKDLRRCGGVPVRKLFTSLNFLARNGERYRNRAWLAEGLTAASARHRAKSPLAPGRSSA